MDGHEIRDSLTIAKMLVIMTSVGVTLPFIAWMATTLSQETLVTVETVGNAVASASLVVVSSLLAFTAIARRFA